MDLPEVDEDLVLEEIEVESELRVKEDHGGLLQWERAANMRLDQSRLSRVDHAGPQISPAAPGRFGPPGVKDRDRFLAELTDEMQKARRESCVPGAPSRPLESR